MPSKTFRPWDKRETGTPCDQRKTKLGKTDRKNVGWTDKVASCGMGLRCTKSDEGSRFVEGHDCLHDRAEQLIH